MECTQRYKNSKNYFDVKCFMNNERRDGQKKYKGIFYQEYYFGMLMRMVDVIFIIHFIFK